MGNDPEDGEFSARLQNLLDLANQGDISARNELIARTYPRLRERAQIMLGSYFRGEAGQYQATSFANDAIVKLIEKVLLKTKPGDIRHFLNLAGLKMRQRLQDLLKGKQVRGDHLTLDGEDSLNAEGAAGDPAAPMFRKEIHDAVDRLPEDLREVVNLLMYSGLKQREIAPLLGITQEAVSARWEKAKRVLRPYLRGYDEGMGET
jgi:RNA polymerase sigma factor (sigma-70 family)